MAHASTLESWQTEVRAKLYKIHRQACIKLKENTPPFSAQNIESDSSDSDDDFVHTNSDNHAPTPDSQATPVEHPVINETPSADSLEVLNQASDSGSRCPRRIHRASLDEGLSKRIAKLFMYSHVKKTEYTKIKTEWNLFGKEKKTDPAPQSITYSSTGRQIRGSTRSQY